MVTKKHQASPVLRNTLIISTSVMVAFVAFVWIAAKDSLSYYTIPHAILAAITAAFLLIKNPKQLVYIGVGIGLIGAITALGLLFAYLPWYLDYLGSK